MLFRGNGADKILDWKNAFCFIAICILTLTGIVALLFRLTLLLDGGVVSGTDPGNWLAYANQLTGGSNKASTSAYPPLIPMVVALLSWSTSKMHALSIVGVTAAIFPAFALFFSLRRKNAVIVSLLVVLGFIFCVMSTEILAWGGYPQVLSQALLIISMSLLAKDIYERSNRRTWMVALFGSLCIGTWVPGLLFLALSFLIYFLGALILNSSYSFRYLLKYAIRLLVVTMLFSLPYVFSYFDSRDILFLRSWNPQNNDIWDWEGASARLFRGWPWWLIGTFWGMTFVTVLFTFVYRCGDRIKLNVLLFSSLFSASLLVYGITMELRSLNLAMMAGWGLWGTSLVGLGASKIFQSKIYFLLVGGLIFFVLAVSVINTKQSRDIFSYYRIVDQDVKYALEWLEVNAKKGDVVVESGNKDGFQYVWWIEGYAMLPSMSGTDTNFFSFKEERQQVETAINLLYGSDQELKKDLLDKNKVVWIFQDKNVLVTMDSLKSLGFVTVFDNLKIRIMKKF